MSRNKETKVLARAAVVENGKARLVETKQAASLTGDRLVAVLHETGLLSRDQHATLTSHVLLSAQVPFIEGRGHLDALNPRSWYSAGPNINWVPESGQPTGRLEIWLDNLEPNGTYLARLEVGSAGNRSFDVRAVTLGAGLVSQTISTSGGFDTLLLQFPSGDGGLGLVRIECDDWSFYEAEISLL